MEDAVQQATTQLRLGLALTDAGSSVPAEASLRTAARLFDSTRFPVEHAKATNALGVALRAQGRLAEAAKAFTLAGEAFQAHRQVLEEGAARFNHGLVLRELGTPDAAIAELQRAQALLDQAPLQRAAATRELGTALLERGDVEDAVPALEEAVGLSERCGDWAGLGAASNVLGLAHLAARRVEPAVAAFRVAVEAHPRGVRPEAFAMSKANLALAHERAGDAPRARLAARQALAITDAPEPVRAQASAIAARLPPGTGDVLAVLDDEPAERWPVVLREELARWADADAGERRAAAEEWVGGQLERPTAASDLAEAWLGVVLELPPDAMETVIDSTLQALATRNRDSQERFRTDIATAMARFHTPQLLRLKATFSRIDPTWG